MKPRTPSPVVLAGLLMLPAIVGCSQPGGDTPGGEATDSEGNQITRAAGSGAWGDETPWRIEEVFRIGGFDADEEAQFGRVVSIDVDASGNVLVLDGMLARLSVFDPDGTFLRTIGSPGEGPGEFSEFVQAVFERSDSLWVFDLARTGLQAFDLSGAYIGRVDSDPVGLPIRLDETDSRIVGQIRDIEGLEESGRSRPDVVRTIDGGYVDTLAWLTVGELLQVDAGVPSVRVFASEPFWDIASDGSVAYGESGTYRVTVRNPDGAVDRVIERGVPPIAVTESIRRALRDAAASRLEEEGVPPDAIGLMLETIVFAEHLPLVTSCILADDGHLWVRQAKVPGPDFAPEIDLQDIVSLSDDLGSPSWDVFDPEGVYLGQVELPARFEPYRMLGDTIWGVQREELDIPSVVGLRVVR